MYAYISYIHVCMCIYIYTYTCVVLLYISLCLCLCPRVVVLSTLEVQIGNQSFVGVQAVAFSNLHRALWGQLSAPNAELRCIDYDFAFLQEDSVIAP